jgi:carnitine 3-dehydrogenase
VTTRVAVVGAGVIGASWAAYFLARGLIVTVTDPAEGAGDRLHGWVSDFWPTLQRIGLSPGAALSHLTFTTDVAGAVTDADFIQENGPERLHIKRSIFAEIEAAAPAEAIIATSSSGLKITEAQAGAKNPERILVGHPFNPPHLIPLVEVVGGEQTTPENLEKALDFYTSIGKKPILIKKEVPGHVANRLQIALWREAFSLVENGVASVADIDTAISNGPGLRWALMGPFLNLHASGGAGGITRVLEHLGPAQREWARDLGAYPEGEDYIGIMAAGVAAELDGYDFAETLRQRDEILLSILAAKEAADQLP